MRDRKLRLFWVCLALGIGFVGVSFEFERPWSSVFLVVGVALLVLAALYLIGARRR